MQETGDRRGAGDRELQLSQLAGQALSGFFISPVCQHLRLFRQLIALDVRIGGNAVKVCRMEPVTTAHEQILFLTGLLLPVHRLFGPFKDPVAAAIANDRIVKLRVGALGIAHDDARLHVEDFLRRHATPDPHQAVNQSIPVINVITAERRLDRLLRSGIKPTHQRGGFRMFESGFKQRFAKVSLGHVQPPSCCH